MHVKYVDKILSPPDSPIIIILVFSEPIAITKLNYNGRTP